MVGTAINLVQELAWPDRRQENVHDEETATAEADESAAVHPYLARTLRQAMTFRPRLQGALHQAGPQKTLFKLPTLQEPIMCKPCYKLVL